MAPAVLLLHRDPVVHQLVTAAFADELEVLSALSLAEAKAVVAERIVALAIVDMESAAGGAGELVGEVRARDDHARAIFFADGKRPGAAWRLADLGTVLPRAHDLERLRVAVRREVRAWQAARGASAGADTQGDQTTRRVPPTQRTEASTERLSYFGPRETPPGEESTPEARRG